jgi:hypothetical protein
MEGLGLPSLQATLGSKVFERCKASSLNMHLKLAGESMAEHFAMRPFDERSPPQLAHKNTSMKEIYIFRAHLTDQKGTWSTTKIATPSFSQRVPILSFRGDIGGWETTVGGKGLLERKPIIALGVISGYCSRLGRLQTSSYQHVVVASCRRHAT